MSLNEIAGAIAGGSTVTVVLIMTLLQISPLKINPWSFIGKVFGKIVRKIGRTINGEIFDEISSLKEQISTLDTKIENVNTEVKSVENAISEQAAIDCRTRIHHFGDEVLHNIRHTKEHFDEILKDIKTYDTYCKEHPNFPNHTTVLTSKRIMQIYEECLKDGDFL